VDAGLASDSPREDLDEMPRPLDGNADGVAGPDIGAYETVSEFSDTDRDGLSDLDEIRRFRCSPLRADTDGDHQSDGQEVVAGTSPMDPDEYFGIKRADRNRVSSEPEFKWLAITGRHYTVMQSTNLTAVPPQWTAVPGWIRMPGSNTPVGYRVPDSPRGPRFYRVACERSP
jgi:hypothetical protein